MDPRAYWNSYVTLAGGPARVAERLRIPYPTIAAVTNGQRGIGRNLALRMKEADESLDPSILLWVRKSKNNNTDDAQSAAFNAETND